MARNYDECEASWKGKDPSEYDIMVYPVLHSVEGQQQLTRYMRARFERAFGDLVVKRPKDCSGVHKGQPYSRMYVRFVRPDVHEHVLRMLYYEHGIDLKQGLGPARCTISNMKAEEVGTHMLNMALERQEQRNRERERIERHRPRSPSNSPPPTTKLQERCKWPASTSNDEKSKPIKPLMLDITPQMISQDVREESYSFLITTNPKKPIIIRNEEAGEVAKRDRDVSIPASPTALQASKKMRSSEGVRPENPIHVNVTVNMPSNKNREKAIREEQREWRTACDRVRMLEDKTKLRQALNREEIFLYYILLFLVFSLFSLFVFSLFSSCFSF